MDRIDAMQLFTRVLERRSFVQAASDFGLPRSRASEAVQLLERHLGVRLLARTTRNVTLTAEGEDYYRRCLAILSAIDDADAAAAQTVPAGSLRIDVHSRFAQQYLLPGLPGFLERYPTIKLHIGEGDRLVDLVAEGVDCAIRVGKPADSGLVGRKLGELSEGTFASPAYLARCGMPASCPQPRARSCRLSFRLVAACAWFRFLCPSPCRRRRRTPAWPGLASAWSRCRVTVLKPN